MKKSIFVILVLAIFTPLLSTGLFFNIAIVKAQETNLPANIQPQSVSEKTSISFSNSANSIATMNPYVLWLLYAIIPAILSAIAIHFSLKWKKYLSSRVVGKKPSEYKI